MTKDGPKKHRILLGGLAAGLSILASGAPVPTVAAERAGLNLGATSFFDGFAGVAPGCTLIAYVGHETIKTLTGPDGGKIADAHLDADYLVPQLACNSSLKLFGGTLGWNTIVPFANASSDTSFLATNGAGLGDIVTGPYIQFAPMMRGGRPVFSQGFEFDFITPSGKYSAALPINPGNDYWSLNPLWKATWLPAPGWEVSWRFNYIYNFDHGSNPNVAGPLDATVKRNGDGVWLNFTASREIFKDLYFGLNGCWLKQVTNDKGVNGALANTQQESLYMGPGLHYTFDPTNIVNVNLYLPVYDANALSGGFRLNLQYAHPLNLGDADE
jgi:hypothetical protein